MKKILVLALGLSVASAFAGTGNVLVWSTGNGNSGNTASVGAWLQASGQFNTVTAFNNDNAGSVDLSSFDRVLYFSNGHVGQDATAIGDKLADFADTGNRLVLATFSWCNQGENTLAGRIMTAGYSPFQVAGDSLYSDVHMASNDGSSFFTGVNAMEGFFHDKVSLSAGATARGLWTDGSLLEAQQGNIVGVNLFPDDSFGTVAGDYRQLFVNSLSANAGVVPEPASMTMLAMGAIALIRRRRNS